MKCVGDTESMNGLLESMDLGSLLGHFPYHCFQVMKKMSLTK